MLRTKWIKPLCGIRAGVIIATVCLSGCGGGSSGASPIGDANPAQEIPDANQQLPASQNPSNPIQPTDPVNPSDDSPSNMPSNGEPTVPVDAPSGVDPETDVPAPDETEPPDGGEMDSLENEPSVPDQGEFDAEINVVEVAISDSPVAGAAGLKRALNDTSTLFLLDNEEATQQLKIMAEPQHTDGDMTNAIGGAFFSFESADTESTAQVVLDTDEKIDAIYECNSVESVCEAIFVDLVSDNAVSFLPKKDRHYVFVRSAQ